MQLLILLAGVILSGAILAMIGLGRSPGSDRRRPRRRGAAKARPAGTASADDGRAPGKRRRRTVKPAEGGGGSSGAVEEAPEPSPHPGTDALTGLLDRQGVDCAFAGALERARRDGAPVALLALELQDFPRINARHGSDAGDAALRHVADALRALTGPRGVAARNAADRFILMLPGLDQDALFAAADALARAIAAPRIFAGAEIRLRPRIGAVVARPGDTPARIWMRRAHAALERSAAGAVTIFDAALDRQIRAETELSTDLSAAFERGEIGVVFQPMADLAAGRLHGFECLVRWHHPERGWLAPAAFLPRLRELGLEDDLDRLVLQKGLAARRRLEEGLGAPCRIAMNVSADQIGSDAFRHSLESAAELHDTAPGLIEIELQPPAQGEPPPASPAGLLAAGYRVTLDRFGRSPMPLDSLTLSGLHGLKLETPPGDVAPAAQTVLRATIGLARELGLTAIATHVETAEQALRMRTLGCRVQQGHWIAPPMPLEQALEWIADDPLPALRDRLSVSHMRPTG